jgi:hypothetical protein
MSLVALAWASIQVARRAHIQAQVSALKDVNAWASNFEWFSSLDVLAGKARRSWELVRANVFALAMRWREANRFSCALFFVVWHETGIELARLWLLNGGQDTIPYKLRDRLFLALGMAFYALRLIAE